MDTTDFKHTVFTPIYNRANMIDDVYDSICNLKYSRDGFEWLIIDDGSTDDLEDHLLRYERENKVNFRCIHKENGGIHTAMNLAIKESRGEYITRIDSDDVLLPDALIQMDRWLELDNIHANDRYVGVVGCCVNRHDGKIRGTEFPFEYEDSSGHEIQVKYKAEGDRSFCMKTSIMRRFPIPEYNDVKWVPEAIIWNRIDLAGYITRFVSTPFSVTSEHASGSMLDAVSNKKKLSALLVIYYSSFHKLTETFKWLSIKERIKCCANYIAVGKITGKHKSFSEAIREFRGNVVFWSVVSFPIALYRERKLRL